MKTILILCLVFFASCSSATAPVEKPTEEPEYVFFINEFGNPITVQQQMDEAEAKKIEEEMKKRYGKKE